MTLDEAIKHCLEVAEQNTQGLYDAIALGGQNPTQEEIARCEECAADHRQLAEWLMELKDLRAEQNDQYVFIHELMSELKEAKRLLKLAVEGYSFIGHITKNYTCPSFTSCSACPMDEGKQCRIWEHADEALALIGEDGDTNG